MNQYREASLDKQDSVEVKNFTRTPNMLIFGYQDISPQEKWLYVCLKHMCGKKGTRHLSLRYISEQTGISTGALSKSKHSEGMIRHLHDAGLIHAEIKRPGGKGNSQYHITITDVWALNQAFFSKTRSDFGQDGDEEPEPVRISDEAVQISDKPVHSSDEPVRNSANTNTRYKTNYKTTEQDESIASPNVDAAPAPVTDLHKWRTDSEKRRAMFADIPPSQDIEEDISMLETRKQEATNPSQQTPDPDLRHTIDVLLHPELLQQTITSPGPGSDAAQAVSTPPASVPGTSASGAVQASVVPKRPRSKKPPVLPDEQPQPKCDSREIQRRVNEHRGYALEEKVDIVRERQAIKTWCNLHTIEEYGLVMAGAKNDKYWGKQENYYRIGGLTLLKITPEILARQRAPLQLVSNGHNGHSNGNQDGLVYQGDLVLWNGQWMTEEEANKTGYNGGFGLYK